MNMETALDCSVDSIMDLIHKCLQCCEVYIHEFNEVKSI